jgi:ABC-type dipeptide/oligopeptide/nickel transport system permease component
MQLFPHDTGTYTFLVTYRKPLIVLCIVSLLILPFKLFYAPISQPVQQDKVGWFMLKSVLQYGILPIVVLIFIRIARKAKTY